MNLLDYLKSVSDVERVELAKRCNTSVGQLNQVAYGNRKANLFLALNLNRETSKAVPLNVLRPDIDWEKLYEDLVAALDKCDGVSPKIEHAA